MADATKVTTFDAPREIMVHLTNISDGTGEATALKVDRSTLTALGGAVVQRLTLMSARWAIQGMSYVSILWDHTTDDVTMVLSGNGYEDFAPYNGKPDPNTSADAVAGAIGDVLLTTAGAVSGGTYDITLTFRKEG